MLKKLVFLSVLCLLFTLSTSSYSMKKTFTTPEPMTTDWVKLSVIGINLDLNNSTFFLRSFDSFNVAFDVINGTPNYSLEIRDNDTLVYSNVFSGNSQLIQNIQLTQGTYHVINISIIDSLSQSKESDLDLEIR